jgi:hypothetical protein
MTPDDLAELKRLEATGGRTDRGFAQYNGELLRHAPALIAAVERCDQLAAENARLREIVERLPRTADGVPVVPGMTVYALQAERYRMSISDDLRDLADELDHYEWGEVRGHKDLASDICRIAAEQLEEIAAENARLREIVERLPRTADGVPVLPGDTLYADLGEGCVEPVTMLGVRKCGVYTGCYSTREAAEAAKETA